MIRSRASQWWLSFALLGVLILAGFVAMGADARGSRRHERRANDSHRSAQGRDASADAGITPQAAFRRYCNRCHPNGGEDTGPSILNKNWTVARMTKQIREGSGRMRAIRPTKLPDTHLPPLMTYLRDPVHAVR